MAPVPPPPSSNAPKFTPIKATGAPNTSALLKSIEKGKTLKKTLTNDRSAPLLNSQPNSTAPNKLLQPSSEGSTPNQSKTSAGLGGLFVNGFPVLRSTNSNIMAEKSSSVLLKKPVSKVAESSYSSISRNHENVVETASKGLKLESPVAVSQAKKQDEKQKNTTKPPKSSEQKSIEWSFPITDDRELPSPMKFSRCKKIYLSEKYPIESSNLSKSFSGSSVSKEDIGTFIKSLKSILKRAADEENFEECLRLQTKLKSFEEIEKRILSGEKICSADLPK